MTMIVESNITKFDYDTARGYVVHWFLPQKNGAERKVTRYFGKSKYRTWKNALEAARNFKGDLIRQGLIDPGEAQGRFRKNKTSKFRPQKIANPRDRTVRPSVSPRIREPVLASMLDILEVAEHAGIFSLAQLRYFLQFARHQGYAQVHLIEAGLFPAGHIARGAFHSLAPSPSNRRRGRKPLLKTGLPGHASGGMTGHDAIARPVELTREGDRLLQRMISLLKSD